jgi:Family of unknown function (DUF5677)
VPTERRALQALLIKTTSIMRSLLDLARQGHRAEVMILARSLADHVITFAWLAIDPEDHYPRWERGDARDRLAAHERFEKRNRALLEPEVKEMFERQDRNKVKYPPDMAGRAENADDYWATRLGFPADDKPFEDAYDVIFKHSSSRTHASVQGLNDVVEPTPEHTVLVLDRVFESQAGVLRASLVIFGLGLKVAAEILPIPDRDNVEHSQLNTKCASGRLTVWPPGTFPPASEPPGVRAVVAITTAVQRPPGSRRPPTIADRASLDCLDRRRERASIACPCRRANERPARPGGGEVPRAATGRSPG